MLHRRCSCPLSLAYVRNELKFLVLNHFETFSVASINAIFFVQEEAHEV